MNRNAIVGLGAVVAVRLQRSAAALALVLVVSRCTCGEEPAAPREPAVDLGRAGIPGVIRQSVAEGGPNPAPVVVALTNTGDCALAWGMTLTTASGGNWLAAAPTGGTLPVGDTDAVSVSVDVLGPPVLAPGTYQGTLVFTGTCTTTGRPALGSPAVVSVNLTVTPIDAVMTLDKDAVTLDVVTLANVWSPTSQADAGTGRTLFSAVWTGAAMIVWGGDVDLAANPDILTSGGMAYSPASDTWSPLGVQGAPSARSNHTAVWTGSKMIVWGGESSDGSLLNSGGVYDTGSDAWSDTPLALAPGGRTSHTAVWTGTHMIVWGGWNGSAEINSGGRYHLASNTWSPTSTVGAPSPRSGHTAVWTGQRMIVWGGAASVELDDGAQYDPVSDSWTPMTLAGAPLARGAHSAVWTGSRMIVWGGVGAGSDGGAYDPYANRWTATSEAGAPPGRFGPAAVWTGAAMVVWGGGNPVQGSGGIYTPANNSWTDTSTDGAPSPRRGQQAVWTGTRMIVFGGHPNLTTTLSSGGILE